MEHLFHFIKLCAVAWILSSRVMNAANQSSIVSKCIRVIDLVAESKASPGFTEIVERSGYAKSSTHRILGILQSEQLIELDQHTKTYRLGQKFMRWASNSWQKSDIQQAATGLLEELAELSANNVALAIRGDDEILILRTVDKYYVSYVPRPGDRGPAHCTALGKVLLAFQPETQRRQAIARLAMTRFTDKTITDKQTLDETLEQVAKQGFAMADGEEFLQVCGIAAPVFNFQGELAGSICIWSQTDRADLTRLQDHLPELLETCTRISGRLGFNPQN